MRNRRLNLHRLAIARIFQRHDAGFVLVAQWQVQGQINISRQTHLLQRLLGGVGRFFLGGIWCDDSAVYWCHSSLG